MHPRSRPWPGRWAGWLLGLLVLAFACKTLASLQLTSLWFDELASAGKSFQPSLKFIFSKLRQDVHPPFYYITLWIAGHIFGQITTVLREFSWIFYILTACALAAGCWLGAVLEAAPGGRRPWLEAALLAAVLGLFWTGGYTQISPPPAWSATRDGSDFRSLSLMAAAATDKYTTDFQCPVLNIYDDLLRQERLSSARSRWRCLPRSPAAGAPAFSGLIGAAPPRTVLIGTGTLPWRLQLEQEQLQPFRRHLEGLGYRCRRDPRSSRAASLISCRLGSG